MDVNKSALKESFVRIARDIDREEPPKDKWAFTEDSPVKTTGIVNKWFVFLSVSFYFKCYFV